MIRFLFIILFSIYIDLNYYKIDIVRKILLWILHGDKIYSHITVSDRFFFPYFGIVLIRDNIKITSSVMRGNLCYTLRRVNNS